MAYVPKYIIKRMIRKDAIKIVEGGIELTFVNIISPIEVYEVPENFLDYFHASFDGNQIEKETISKITITLGEEVYKISDAKSYIGKIIPVGAILKIFVPGLEVEKGKEYEIKIKVVESPIDITVKRVIQ